MNAREKRRRRSVDELVDSVALCEFDRVHGGVELSPITVVIAAYKERDNIANVVRSMPEKLFNEPVSVLVVVDGEDDGTGEQARLAGGFACIAPVNRGQGAALRLGYRIAREHGARFIVTADGDGQASPGDLETVLEPVVSGTADFVNGSRRLGHTHGTDIVRNIGVVVFAAIITVLTRTKVTDTANPVRAFPAELPASLELDEPQYQASELLIGAVMHGWRFTERPVTMRERASGHSKKGGNLLYGYRYGTVVLRTYLRERRRINARP